MIKKPIQKHQNPALADYLNAEENVRNAKAELHATKYRLVRHLVDTDQVHCLTINRSALRNMT